MEHVPRGCAGFASAFVYDVYTTRLRGPLRRTMGRCVWAVDPPAEETVVRGSVLDSPRAGGRSFPRNGEISRR